MAPVVVRGPNGEVMLQGPAPDPDPHPTPQAWVPPGMAAPDGTLPDPSHGPSGPHGDGVAGGPFTRPC